VNKVLLKLSLAATIGGLLGASPTFAQNAQNANAPAPKNPNVQILEKPMLEMALEDMAILRWMTDNPGGSPAQFAVADCGTDPNALNHEWKSHIRLNQGHDETMWRVSVTGLTPNTNYYCTVTSEEFNGTPSGPRSDVVQFTTPGVGDRIVNVGQPP
jgi:hypothetical protein